MTPSATDLVEYGLRKRERFLQHEGRADLHRHQHLVQAVIEGDRKDVKDNVVGCIFEIGGDRCCRGHDILMRHHHALGEAGRPRGVDQHGQIGLDAGGIRQRRCAALSEGVLEADAPDHRGFARGTDHNGEFDRGRFRHGVACDGQ